MFTLKLPARLEKVVLSGHPWIYRDQLPSTLQEPTGSWVRLSVGKLSAYGLWDADSPLAIRVYSRETLPDAHWVRERVRAAWRLRELALNLSETNAFRWLNGEGDALPGVVADYYAGYVVIVLSSASCEAVLPWVVDALRETHERSVHKSHVHERSVHQVNGIVLRVNATQGAPQLKLLYGQLPPADLVVREHGIALRANLAQGQKTGLFLDQRENRKLVERFAKGRRVLNLFAYSGGFSLYAARGGATRIVSVDSSRGALEDARENFRLNGIDPDAHEFVTADVFEYLEQSRVSKQSFDLIVCDPPSFGSQKRHQDRVRAAYERLTAAGIKLTGTDALYAASSCTARLSSAELLAVVAEAARRSRRQFQLMADTGHAPDHPIAAAHPEGRYLKFLLGRVTPRA